MTTCSCAQPAEAVKLWHTGLTGFYAIKKT